MPKHELRSLAVVLFALLGVAPAAIAQTFPSRPIRMIVAFAPGGATDILARALSQQFSLRTNSVVVVNTSTGTFSNVTSYRRTSSSCLACEAVKLIFRECLGDFINR